jgi:hypothetical protein
VARRPEVRSRPRVRWIPKAHSTDDAADAIFLASRYNLAPDLWQEEILYGWLGRRRDGKWCAGRCGLSVPRQNGKNGVIEIRELFGMVVLGEAILHTAHEVKTARKAFKRLKYFFGEKANDPDARFPELNALVVEVRNTNGQEAIFLKDVYDEDGRFVRRGGSVEFVARSKGSGRGFTVDVLILDEAQHLSDEELEAIRSAVSSAPLGNPQVIYTGTPPNPEKGELGQVFTRIRKGAGKDKRLCWIEYGAPDGPLPDIDDRRLLFETNPALELRHANGAYGLTMDVVLDERADLSPEGYARERFGWWGDPDRKRGGVIDMNQWRGLTVQAGRPTRGLIVAHVSPNLDWTSIAVASDGPEGRTLLLVDRAAGTGWAVQSIVDLVAELGTVGKEVLEVALTPTAQIFSAKLTKAGVEHKVLTNAEVGRGCTAFQEGVKGREYAHVGQEELDDAVRNATTRYVGNTQQWDQRDHRIDITPIVAGSVAAHRWALATAKPKTPPPPPRRAAPARPPRDSIATAGF